MSEPERIRSAQRWRRSGTLAVTAGLLGACLSTAALAAPASARAAYVSNPAALVNPFIGTTDGGNTFPGADTPFGMIHWSPDTVSRPDGGGYSAVDKDVIGYSLTHLSGPGCPAEGDVPILPTVRPLGRDPEAMTEPLDHHRETASPGYYQSEAGGVNTQLTTTARSGLARFTFPATAAAGSLLFKLADSQTPVSADTFAVVNDQEVEGSVTTGQFCGSSNTYTLYFDMVFNRPFASSGTWSTGGNGAFVSFATAGQPVVKTKVGISYVSTADAVLNRTTEDPGWDFGAVRAAARASWQSMLDKIRVGGGTPQQQVIFYTALYHCLLFPSVISDVNGQYTGADGEVHQLAGPQQAQYANYSGWDIYRSEIQLLAMLAPEQTSDMVSSMLNSYAQIGELTKWSEDDGETYQMVGDPADSIIADADAFGATDFDTSTALADMVAQATTPNDARPGLAYDEDDGYLPIDGSYGCCNFYGPVSTQLEYDTADNAIAQFATSLGDDTVATTFAIRAQNWQNIFNPESDFFQPKESSGAFQPGFDPTSGIGFVEADAYVYTAMVPFDLQGVAASAGGDNPWISFLNGLTSSVTTQGATQIQMGDEPSFDIPWEYDYVGDPAQTENVVRQIQDQLFSDAAGGLAGNDDLGAMSSWYVWSALGAYPEMPGSAEPALGSPLFSAIALHLGDGKTITETAPTAVDNAPYVERLSMNGTPWSGTYLPASIFADGGTLVWTLGATPESTWGTSPADAPPSNTQGLLPALGYLSDADNGDLVVAPGAQSGLTLGVQSMADTSQQISWSVATPAGSGITVAAPDGSLTVASGTRATTSLQVQTSSETSPGQYLVDVALQSVGGPSLPDVAVEVDVTGGP